MEIIYEWNLPLDGILTEIDFEPKPESAFGQKIYFGRNLPLDLIGLQLDFKGTLHCPNALKFFRRHCFGKV